MAKIEMIGDNLLVKKTIQKKLDFEVAGDSELGSPVYEVCYAGKEAPAKALEQIIVKPGSYETLIVDGISYLFVEGYQVAGKIK